MCQLAGQLDWSTSGVVFAATSRAIAMEASMLWNTHQVCEVYTALVRGLMPLNNLIRCHTRLCKPSEGSVAWRLAGSRREGREACTLLRGICHGSYRDEPCTLVEIRPVTSWPQQCRLHCMAVGHPIVGDEVHSTDRRMDWRFERALSAPRLFLHCWHFSIPLAQGTVEVTAPDPFSSILERTSPEATSDAEGATCRKSAPARGSDGGVIHASLLKDAGVNGLTTKLCAADAWSAFAGGLSEGTVDDTHWDAPSVRVRPCRGPPYGPPEWDDRAAAASKTKV